MSPELLSQEYAALASSLIPAVTSACLQYMTKPPDIEKKRSDLDIKSDIYRERINEDHKLVYGGSLDIERFQDIQELGGRYTRELWSFADFIAQARLLLEDIRKGEVARRALNVLAITMVAIAALLLPVPRLHFLHIAVIALSLSLTALHIVTRIHVSRVVDHFDSLMDNATK